MKMFSGDRIPKFAILILMASELTNCVIDIPGNIRARRMLIFRDPVTNVTERSPVVADVVIAVSIRRPHTQVRALARVSRRVRL